MTVAGKPLRRIKSIGPNLAAKLAKLIDNAAWTYARKLPNVDLDDLRQDGWVSVMRALASYDEECGPPGPYLWRAIAYGMQRGINKLRKPTSGHGHRPGESTKGITRVAIDGFSYKRPGGHMQASAEAAYWWDPLPLPDALLADAQITHAVIERLRDLGASSEVVSVLTGETSRMDLAPEKLTELTRVKRHARGDRRVNRLLRARA